MSNVLFLLIAPSLIAAGSVWLWLRYRRPSSIESGIEEFSREMNALAPPGGRGGDVGARRSPAAERARQRRELRQQQRANRGG